MSFETMRQHQKKIFLPLAIVVTLAFVFFMPGSSGGIGSMFKIGESVSLDKELVRLGQDLESAQMISPPPRKWYQARVERERSHIKDPEKFKQKVREEVDADIRAYYHRRGAQVHYLPVKEGERLGVRITDMDLNERVREIVETSWDLKPFDDKAYAEECSSRSLSKTRFETLVRGQMIRKRVESMLAMTAGASESEIFAAYTRDKQKVRVQYFQRDSKDFIGKVQILPGKRPEEKKPKDAKKEEKAKDPAKAEKSGDGADTKKPDKEKPESKEEKKKPKPGKIYEAEIKEKFEKLVKDLKKRYKYSKDDDFEWPAWAARQSPEFFTEPKIRVEYLVAVNKDFRRGIKVSAKDIKTEYEDNKNVKYLVKPDKSKKKAGEKDKPRPLDSKLKKEIKEQLIKERAGDAAVKALEKAIKEYNDAKPEARPSDEKSWKAFLKKRRLTRKSTGAETEDGISNLPAFKGAMLNAGDLFEKTGRKKLKAKFARYVRMEEGRGHLSFRLLEYHKRRLLSFEKARAGFTYRLKRLEAWALAEEAIEADLAALKDKDRKLDPKRVRESVLLDPSSEPAEVVRNNSLAIGQASKRFFYRELLGPAAEKKKAEDEKKKTDKEKEKKPTEKQPKTLEERITESLDSGVFGYRVIVLVERSVPSFEDFREDRVWRRRWKPVSPMDEYYMRYVERKVPKDSEWRKNFIQGYFREKYQQLRSKPN
jgi:hypothetical protein